jgi:RNA polymerase sigma-70 factor, ECF subfamily
MNDVTLFRTVGAMEADTLLSRARQLDSQALAFLHDQYYPVVYRYVTYRLEDALVCEDITSEVFLRLVETLHNGRGNIQDLRGWLLGTASHLVSDFLRHKYRRPTEALEAHEERLKTGESPEGYAEQSMHAQQVREAMTRLTPDQQHVIALRFSQELSLEETAQMMGKSVGAVKVLQFRALEALRRVLEERWKQ